MDRSVLRVAASCQEEQQKKKKERKKGHDPHGPKMGKMETEKRGR
jgi:hypothetical protein